MRQVHDHSPEGAADNSAFFWKLGDRYDGISQLLLVHHTANPDLRSSSVATRHNSNKFSSALAAPSFDAAKVLIVAIIAKILG